MNYIINALGGDNLNFEGTYDENSSEDFQAPKRTAGGLYRKDSVYGTSTVHTVKLRAKTASYNTWKLLYAYLKGRNWTKETIYLDQFGGTIEGYITNMSTVSDFKGAINTRKEISISIQEV